MNTAKKLFEDTLIGLNKKGVPSFPLEDFLRYANKAYIELIDEREAVWSQSDKVSHDLSYLAETVRLKIVDPTFFEKPIDPSQIDWLGSVVFTDGLLDVDSNLTYTYKYSESSNTFQIPRPENLYTLDAIVVNSRDASGKILQTPCKRVNSNTLIPERNNYYQKPRITKGAYIQTSQGETFDLSIGKIYPSIQPLGFALDYLRIPAKISLAYEELSPNYAGEYSMLEDMPINIYEKLVSKIVFLYLESTESVRTQTHPATHTTNLDEQEALAHSLPPRDGLQRVPHNQIQ